VGALVLLVLGIGVHAVVNQPRMNEITGLRERQASLLGQAGTLARLEAENRELERVNETGGGAGAAIDPFAFVGRAVDAAGLTRIEMGTEASGTTGGLQVTKFSLRVAGIYPRIVDFVRNLERSPRTVTILALTIEPMAESSLLEARMHISVYDPATGR
jgi:hypothetical protein